ncbi:MAG: MFS transporter, partial [Thermoplasmata archaeon]|nr:MFS transporter [Thermoplasmata archaeon]
WRSIFWVNLPVGVFGTLWAWYQLVEVHAPERHARIDWAGNLTFGLGLTLALVGLTLGALQGWSEPIVVASLLTAPILLAAFVRIEQTQSHPMFDLGLFRIRTFVVGNVAAGLSALARGAFTFVIVFYFQGILLYSAERAGLLLIPLSLAFAIAGPISGTVSDRTGARYLGTSGLLISVLGFALLINFPANGPYFQLAAAMTLLGVGQGMFAAPNRAEVMSSVPADRRGIAAGTGTTFLNGGNLGSLALGFTVLAAAVPHATLQAVFSGRPTSAPIDVGAFMAALHTLFAVALLLTVGAAVVNLLRGGRPAEPTVGSSPPGAPANGAT